MTSLLLRDILALPMLANSNTVLLTGSNKLETPIRWAHVTETARGGELIKGGELLLTTGVVFGSDPQKQRELIDSFCEAGAAALLVEVGVQIEELPSAILERCRFRNLPLIATYEEVRFIEITESIHREILNRQTRQVENLQRINESFWGLMFNGAPPEQLVLHAFRELGKPIILEDLNHRVVLFSEGQNLPSELLISWERKSRIWSARNKKVGLIADPISIRDPFDPEITWSCIDIQARGHHWGRLFARDVSSADAKANHILRHLAMALAIERLGNPNPHSWSDLRERAILERLLSNRFTTVTGQKRVLESSGFHTENRSLVAAEFRIPENSGTVNLALVREALQDISPIVQVLVTHRTEDATRVMCAISGDPKWHSVDELIELAFGGLQQKFRTFDFAVRKGLTGPIDLGSALHQLSLTRPTFQDGSGTLTFIARDRIGGLLTDLHNDARVQAYSESILLPILRYDERNGTDLISTLRVLLKHPTSRSAASEELHLSRTALYSKISTIERLLEIDLADGDQAFEVSLALRTCFNS